MQIEYWTISRLVPYSRNPRRNDHAVERMKASINEFGFRIPILARSNGEVVDGHLRLRAAQQLGIPELPVVLCDEWTPAQVKAFRLLVNRSATWAEWDEELVAFEIEELKAADFNLELTGFDPGEIDAFLRDETQEQSADVIPDVPKTPVSRVGDLWICGQHRLLCGDATSAEAVARLLENRKPILMVTDPPYGIELDTEWRDRAGLNGCGAAEASYMKHRTEGHSETRISGDTRADWSDALALVPNLEVAYVWHASKFTREVLDGLLRIGFVHHQQIIWDKGRAVLTRTHYWFQHEPCWYVRKKNAPWFGKPGELMRRAILNHTLRGELVYEPFLGSGTTLAAAELTGRICCGTEIDPKYMDVIVRRWQQISGQQPVLDGDGRSFEEVSKERVPATEEA